VLRMLVGCARGRFWLKRRSAAEFLDGHKG
jgi:hypothetical protein